MALLPSLLSSLAQNILTLLLLTWDFLLLLLNTLSPLLPRGKVVPPHAAGAGGKWPPYTPPGEGDSRSPCPALNALANHGILPHDGRSIPFRTLSTAVRTTYNFSPTFCIYVPLFCAFLLSRSYLSGTFDLSDLSVHNGIEHDASLVRHDAAAKPDQGEVAHDLVEALLKSASGEGGKLTMKDMARALEKRRKESAKTNGQYTMSAFHKIFGSSNAATLLLIFDPTPAELSPFLHDERLPENWEPAMRARWGLTMAGFQTTVLGIEGRVREPLWSGLGAQKKWE